MTTSRRIYSYLAWGLFALFTILSIINMVSELAHRPANDILFNIITFWSREGSILG